jgi:hypothetical protein
MPSSREVPKRLGLVWMSVGVLAQNRRSVAAGVSYGYQCVAHGESPDSSLSRGDYLLPFRLPPPLGKGYRLTLDSHGCVEAVAGAQRVG